MRNFVILCLTICLSGCETHTRLDYTTQLMRRDDFAAVKQYAPEWGKEALKIISYLEFLQERQ